MTNRKLILLFLILAAVILPGCTYGNYSSTRSVQINTSSQMYMSYAKFNGTRTTQVRVKKGKPIDVHAKIVSKEGNLDLSVTDDKKNKIYNGKNLPTSSFVVTIDKEGVYNITVRGEKHKGSYKITWGEANEENNK
ncbi:hypothetical protein [Ruminiclostridium cellulolyticum]|uniref:Uncharacterized protein n=1 Tax=Ruminiclostridium cellulolyticum (strain ATCC 35319 / DSM 5812 / JCM 6584 / H10) TaxID=394503 RepID=B8I3C5_RUMCH|nr:hypothetical protein [Ruminiclostridium cellulolyticum]ACL76268.1 hypothetical protein Ccel_1920 [Ruminiclostridium cellulolyticum H10]